MNFILFQKKVMPYPVISLNDILKVMPNFNRIQLDRWEKKGYVNKIRRGYYSLPGTAPGTAIPNEAISGGAGLESLGTNPGLIFYAANKIYSPSYISLEKALRIYNFIPEEVFQITSVSTKKTSTFNTPIGNFSYRHIKPSLFFGYVLTEIPGLDHDGPGRPNILLAEPEKAILDYIYLNPRLKTIDDFAEMRINAEEFNKQIDTYKLFRYLEAFENKALCVRVETFLDVYLTKKTK